MHLDDHPPIDTFFKRTGPAAIIPSYRLSIPLRMVIKKAWEPGGVTGFGEFYPQVTDGEVSGLEFILKLGLFPHFPEGFKTDDGGMGVGMKDKKVIILCHNGKKAINIFR